MSKTPIRNEKKNIYYGSVAQISQLIQQRQLSPVEIVEACLKRIEEFNPKLNAFITVLADEAREQAKIAEEEIRADKWRGPLHGIPIGVKDFYDTAGIKTTAAFEQFANRTPAKDALSVARFKEAGAIILGKTNMHQLGMGTTGLESYFGPVQNPWNSEYIPGGSSSGSAAAVASGMCFATLDTDAIGSCRLPAACCGVVGFKGTYGLISPQGILEGEEPPDEFILWMNHPGITTRSVKDTAIVLEVLADRNQHNVTSNFVRDLGDKQSLRVGIGNNFHADPDVTNAFEKAIDIFRTLQYQINTVPIPFVNLEKGIENIEADRKGIVDQVFKDVEILLLPTTITTVPTVKGAAGNPQGLSPENTALANYYGLPAISVPNGFDRNGLPMGLQVVGKPWHDATVLRLALQFQETTSWNERHPIP
jgi:aspartyl-tRNA(Asn)/glutamyl-tRNA(Gln) amidotransferase subunit A